LSPKDLRRLRLLALLGLVAFGVLCVRLVQLQIVEHHRLAHVAQQQQTRRVILEPERGRIYDRHLRSLADNVALSRVSVRPREVKNPKEAQAFLAQTTGPQGVRRFRAGRSRHAAYVRISAQLSPRQELALRRSELPEGVQLEALPGRVYPLAGVARPVVGVLGVDGQGLEGLEQVNDRELRGKPGWATLYCDGRGGAYQLPRSMVKLPEAGASIVTSLDLDAESIAALKLREAVDATGARSGMAVFADPTTGDILAMVTVDSPALVAEGGGHRNRVIADQYEPGSTFKIITACAALEERVLTPEDSFYVDHGEADFGGFTIHDSHVETGWFTFETATSHSSNVCYAHIGTRVGASALYRYARLFGCGQPTRIALPGEASGEIRDPARWSGRSLATISIGQEVMTTPLQILMAYCAVANGGILLRPRIVTAILDDDGAPLREYPVERVRRVVSPETARIVRSFFRAAVLEGTARQAALPWCEVAGKTGTAQKSGENERGYGGGYHVASFVGMAPYSNPTVVGLIVLDEPRGAYYGGEIAAPVFRDILAAWAAQGRGPIKLPPATIVRGCGEIPAGDQVPDVRLLDPDRARALLARAGYEARVTGEAEGAGRVAAQSPEAGALLGPGGTVELVLAEAAKAEATVPDVRGLALRDALLKLSSLAIEVGRVKGSGAVIQQSPQPGTPVRKGTKCTLVLAARGR
jgi:cell division protein FtsI (penicillin-binding protein 3)